MYLGEGQVPVDAGVIAVGGGPAHQMGSGQRAFDHLLQFHAHRYVVKMFLDPTDMYSPGDGVVGRWRGDDHAVQSIPGFGLKTVEAVMEVWS